jgi:DNA-directed RNA polymerase specialized sigma24 family protein
VTDTETGVRVDEREQVRQVYAVSAGRLVAQLYGMTGDYAEAQDVVQEAFVRALARPSRLRHVDNPEAWLRTVAMNLARSRHRRRMMFAGLVRAGKVERSDPPAPGLTPDHVALVAALQRLPEKIRRTIVLYHLADLPVAEVAAIEGCTIEAAKTRLVRGRRALADHLGDHPDPPAPVTSRLPHPDLPHPHLPHPDLPHPDLPHPELENHRV